MKKIILSMVAMSFLVFGYEDNDNCVAVLTKKEYQKDVYIKTVETSFNYKCSNIETLKQEMRLGTSNDVIKTTIINVNNVNKQKNSILDINMDFSKIKSETNIKLIPTSDNFLNISIVNSFKKS